RREKYDQKGKDDRADADPSSQYEECDERDERRNHENVAMGEIDHADDAKHHRVADGDEAIDRAERDAVDELLDEDFHGRAPAAEPRLRDSAGAEALAGVHSTSNGGAASCSLDQRAFTRRRNRSFAGALSSGQRNGESDGPLPVALAAWRADPDSHSHLGVRRTSLTDRLRRLAGR